VVVRVGAALVGVLVLVGHAPILAPAPAI
jgi:hypothetical protein